MPKRNGLEVCATIRTLEREFPVNNGATMTLIVHSANMVSDEELQNLGVDAFLAKPFTQEKWKQKLAPYVNF